MNTRVLLQARLASTRLPAKALLPIRGMPSIVLAAKRAGNLGLDLCVLTSTEAEDDHIVSALSDYNIPYQRGPLENVFKRFQLACSDMDKNDCIVRLTGDNLIPDGELIKETLEVFEKNALDILTTTFPLSKAPYGLSIEIFRVGLFRSAEKEINTAYDQEHVTPRLYQLAKNKLFYVPQAIKNQSLGHVRCTIDSFQDYLVIKDLFERKYRGTDPIALNWNTCISNLSLAYKEIVPVPLIQKNNEKYGKIVLGTAQLGMDYGIANQIGMPDKIEREKIIQLALDAGITHFDTARAYGVSEKNIGNYLKNTKKAQVKVITKLDPLHWLNESHDLRTLQSAVEASIYCSLVNLQINTLDVLLLHRWQHRYSFGGKIWELLLEMKEKGLIQQLGASVSTIQEAIEALAEKEIKYLQIPFNLLDWRWHDTQFQKSVANRPDVVIHSRSALLQGLLSQKTLAWPYQASAWRDKINDTLDYFVARFHRKDRIDLCFAFVRSFPWIDGVVVGMETFAQLMDNLKYFNEPTLEQQQIEIIQSELVDVPIEVLDPARWKE